MFISGSHRRCPYTPCGWRTCGSDERACEAARETHMAVCAERQRRWRVAEADALQRWRTIREIAR